MEDLSQGKSVIPSQPMPPSKKLKALKEQKKKKKSKHVQFSQLPPRRSPRLKEILLDKDLVPRSLRGSKTKYNLR